MEQEPTEEAIDRGIAEWYEAWRTGDSERSREIFERLTKLERKDTDEKLARLREDIKSLPRQKTSEERA